MAMLAIFKFAVPAIFGAMAIGLAIWHATRQQPVYNENQGHYAPSAENTGRRRHLLKRENQNNAHKVTNSEENRLDNYFNQTDCPICFNKLEKVGTQTLKCFHIFHVQCIEKLRIHDPSAKCPLCRKEIIIKTE